MTLEQNSQERRRGEDVIEGFVSVVELNAVTLAEFFKPMVVGKRFENAEGIECARNCGGVIAEPYLREGLLEHGEVEPRVVRREYAIPEQFEKLLSQLREHGRLSDVFVVDAVHRACLGRGWSTWADKRTESFRFRSVTV